MSMILPLFTAMAWCSSCDRSGCTGINQRARIRVSTERVVITGFFIDIKSAEQYTCIEKNMLFEGAIVVDFSVPE
jgi:hypothetical protein